MLLVRPRKRRLSHLFRSIVPLQTCCIVISVNGRPYQPHSPGIMSESESRRATQNTPAFHHAAFSKRDHRPRIVARPSCLSFSASSVLVLSRLVLSPRDSPFLLPRGYPSLSSKGHYIFSSRTRVTTRLNNATTEKLLKRHTEDNDESVSPKFATF